MLVLAQHQGQTVATMILRATFILLYLTLCDSARILGVFTVPSISHQVVFRKLTQELARRGHELVVITTDPVPEDKQLDNLREIDLHHISYKFWKEEFTPKMVGLDYNPIHFLETVYSCTEALFEVQFAQPEVQELLSNRNQTFDLLLLETASRLSFGLMHVFKAPVISISSLGVLPDQPGVIGFPGHPLLFPHLLAVRSSNYSLWDKVTAIYHDFQIGLVHKKLEWNENLALRRLFGEDCPLIQDLMGNVDLSFIHEDSVMETRPVPPSVVYIGGIHMEPVKELPKNLKSFLDKSKNGIIYMSLGTNVEPSLLHPHIKNIFIKVLTSLNYDVILKWDSDELKGHYENLLTSKWIPQNDLLRHPKVKLFITQAGIQSTQEAISAKVPLIGLPVFGDQLRNADRYELYGIGIRLNIDTLTEQSFRDAIMKVLGDRRYQENIARLAARIQDQPHTPLQRAVWWSEYVIRHNGATHLKSAQANASWFDYLAIDAALVILALLVLAGLLFVIVLNIMIELYNFGYKGNLEFMRPKKYD